MIRSQYPEGVTPAINEPLAKFVRSVIPAKFVPAKAGSGNPEGFEKFGFRAVLLTRKGGFFRPRFCKRVSRKEKNDE